MNNTLEKLMLDELRNSCRPGAVGGFLPGVKQIANVAALPGIVGKSVGLPDVHSGYGFAIGICFLHTYYVFSMYYFMKLGRLSCNVLLTKTRDKRSNFGGFLQRVAYLRAM